MNKKVLEEVPLTREHLLPYKAASKSKPVVVRIFKKNQLFVGLFSPTDEPTNLWVEPLTRLKIKPGIRIELIDSDDSILKTSLVIVGVTEYRAPCFKLDEPMVTANGEGGTMLKFRFLDGSAMVSTRVEDIDLLKLCIPALFQQ